MSDEDLVPESAAVALFNRLAGADCKTLDETVAYLKAHPEARQRMEARAARDARLARRERRGHRL